MEEDSFSYISNKYTLVNKLSSGSFGTVYNGIHNITQDPVIIKIELNSSTHHSLAHEAKIYNHLLHLDGVPTIKWYENTEQYKYIVLPDIGVSLSTYISEVVLSKEDFVHIAQQLITNIQMIHDKNIIHCDIKPDNIIICPNTKRIWFIDFGFATSYKHSNNIHCEPYQLSSIVGSLNYISLNIHDMCSPSRRDDMESIVYVLLYLVSGALPWINAEDIQAIVYSKQSLINNDWFSQFPNIRNILVHCRQLHYTDSPDYIYLYNEITS